jgi:hypothetical protein
MIGRVNPAAIFAGRPDVQKQAMMAQQQPTRQGLLGQARSVVGGLLGGVQNQFRNAQESDEGFNLLRFRPPPGMNQSEMIMLAGAGLQDLDPLFGGGRMQAAQQMIDQRIQGRQAEEQRLAQMEQMQAFRATLPPEQHQMFDMNPEGFMDQITSAEFRAPNYQVFGENIYRTDRGLERVGDVQQGDPDAIRTLRMLQENPDLMAVEAARRSAGAAQNNVPPTFQALELRAAASGLQPGTEEYRTFMLNNGAMPEAAQNNVPTAFQALELRAAASGLEPGTEEYRTFMLNNGAMPEAEPDPSALRLGAEAMGRIAPNIPPLLAAQRQLQELERQGVTFTQGVSGVGATVAAGIPFAGGALERAIGSDDRDAMVRAVSQFEAAILPILSGAAVTDSEAQRYVRAQLPQPGDSARIRDLKAQARQGMIDVFQAAIRGESVDFAAMDAATATIEREMAAERQRQRDDRRGGQNQPRTRLRFNPETGEFE